MPQYKIISPNTVGRRIDDIYTEELQQMKKDFELIKYLCATCDIWSTKTKSFMGITVHWIDEKTLDRKSRACRRFESPHTADRIASLLFSIYGEFGIADKIIATVTDNASNFVKAFKDFGISFELFSSFMETMHSDDVDEPLDVPLNEPLDDVRSA